MRNRWFHRPLLHTAVSRDRRVSWLELLYDLVFVGAFLQLGNGLEQNLTANGVVVFAGVFVALWVCWTGVTFVQNRFEVDDLLHRGMVVLLMFAVGAMALGAPMVLLGDVSFFALANGLALLVVTVIYFRLNRQVPEARDYTRFWGAVFLGVSGLWLVAAWLPEDAAVVVGAVATLVVLVAPLTSPSRELAVRFPQDFGHLGERYGLLTLFVLGVSFVRFLGMTGEAGGLGQYLETGSVLIVTVAVWWIYFDDVAGARLREGRGHWIIWVYSHVTLPLGITALGVGLKVCTTIRFDEPAPAGPRWLLAGSLALVYLSVAAIDSVTERRQSELSDRARVNARSLSAAFLLVLAPAAASFDGGLFMAAVVVVSLGQVVLDMAMAPWEAVETGFRHRSVAEIARARVDGAEAANLPPRRDFSEAVRKGTPGSLRNDLYFYFMSGSWMRVFVAFGLLFLVANVFFAVLYLIEPGSIHSAADGSFLDAFFFSVQTMSTIGYGGMSPATDYGNWVVTVEAALTMVVLAIVTGLVFAKASRPKASVLFSEPMVITTLNEKPVLMFRVGNARGNEVVDASLSLTVLRDEVSREGQHIRRLRDLKLVRGRTPIFALSWIVMHEIDEDSPLAGIDFASDRNHRLAFIATVMGHDGTYGQTIYARHIYGAETLRPHHRFVDIMSQLDDGRLMIDFSRFHDTEPEEDRSA